MFLKSCISTAHFAMCHLRTGFLANDQAATFDRLQMRPGRLQQRSETSLICHVPSITWSAVRHGFFSTFFSLN